MYSIEYHLIQFFFLSWNDSYISRTRSFVLNIIYFTIYYTYVLFIPLQGKFSYFQEENKNWFFFVDSHKNLVKRFETRSVLHL